MRLIDADALERSIRKTGRCNQCKNQCLSRVSISKWDLHCRAIAQAPTIEAKPVQHGRWIDKKSSIKYIAHSECSACGSWQGAYWMNYCPHCGAKMDGGKEDA